MSTYLAIVGEREREREGLSSPYIKELVSFGEGENRKKVRIK